MTHISQQFDQGATVEGDGVRFRLWAPGSDSVTLVLEREGQALPMRQLPGSFFELFVQGLGAGTVYRYRLADGLTVPDPASRFQPQDVHGPSEVIDHAAYRWRESWSGRPWNEIVLYELHVGTFTPQGTFRAAIGKLDHLAVLGVTAIQIMPIADFPGRRNWGYDGVLPYAPDSSYGRPDDLKALVEAAHARGIAVLLDVVYNHFGPDGNYLPVYAPVFFTDRHHTPWGAAINYDGVNAKPVREFIIGNALYWVREFHLDGLRLDAVHAILDDSDRHLLEELAERVRASAVRPLHLLLENEENDPTRLRRADDAPVYHTAQWNDDVHHVLHTAVTGERTGYYADYEGDTELLGTALAEGFGFQGQLMPYRGSPRGQPSADLPPAAFVAFIQNHDQIGNRAFGERLNTIAAPAALRAVAATYLLLPQTPMLFMGEEWGATQPFPFFCDFEGELGDAIRNGRRAEFAAFPEFHDPAQRDRIPDPLAEATFASAKLDWNDLAQAPHADWLAWYRRVLNVRRDAIAPVVAGIRAGGRYTVVAPRAVEVRWPLDTGNAVLLLAANLSNAPVTGFSAASGQVLWLEGSIAAPDGLGAWSVRWSIEPGWDGLAPG